jgi:hypothetical protein
MPNDHQRYLYPVCYQTFSENFDSLYYRRVSPEQIWQVGKDKTQRLERTNGIVRQQTGRWHRRQSKFGKVWEQTKVTTRLVVSDFNWVWQHSRFKTTAAQRAGLALGLGLGTILLLIPQQFDALSSKGTMAKFRTNRHRQ